MKRRDFIQSVPVTLAILPCLPDVFEPVPDDAFEAELRRRFENLPAFLKGDGVGMNLATAVIVLSKPNPRVELLERNPDAK